MKSLASPSSSRFASVMPLPDGGDQSEASSSDKAAYTSSSESESEHQRHINSDSEADDVSRSDSSDDDEAVASSSSSSVPDTRRYSSGSSSVVSSALSFSSDDEQQEPLDIEAPLHPHYRSRSSRATANGASTTNNSKDREITMQAIRNGDTVGFVALLIPLTGISTMVVTETLACSHHFDCTTDYPTLSYAATFRPEGTAFMIGMCLTAFFILVSSCLFYWFMRLRMRLGDGGGADAQERYTALVCLVAGIATAVTLAGLAILDMRGYHDAHITFTVLFFISSWVLIVFCHLARRLLLLREHEREAEKAGGGALLSTSTCPRLLMDGGAGVWVSLKRWRRLSISMAFTLGRLFILAGVTSTVLCEYTWQSGGLLCWRCVLNH